MICKSVIFTLTLGCAAFAAQASDTQTCPTGQHWVRAYSRKAYIRADGTAVRATNVSAHCQENPKGYDFWKSKLFNSRLEQWPRPGEKSANWTPEEIERVLEGLGTLPDSLRPKRINGIYRMRRSNDFPNPATTRPATGEITLYDTAFDKSHNLARIFAHELAHLDYTELSKQDHDDLLQSLNWFEYKLTNGKQIYIRGRETFVEEDGKLSPDEDFANDVEYFLFGQKRLREVTPSAVDWIKNHFSLNWKGYTNEPQAL